MMKFDLKSCVVIFGVITTLLGGFKGYTLLQAQAASNTIEILRVEGRINSIHDYMIEEQRRAEDREERVHDKLDKLWEHLSGN